MARQTDFDQVSFFLAWLSDPFRVAALVPSGRSLAQAITAEITQESTPVIELGAGTGAFTQALLDRGVPPERLVLIESGKDFVEVLRNRFPRTKALCLDAARLRQVKPFDGEMAGAVVSGLPLLSMPAKQVISILDGAFAHLRPGAAFYQFTYGPRCPVPRKLLDRLGLKARRIAGTFANLPPAAVYKIFRRPPRRLEFGTGKRPPLAPSGQSWFGG